jgi:hypothetical protein
MATNIPPHNLGELVDVLSVMIENPEATVSILSLVSFVVYLLVGSYRINDPAISSYHWLMATKLSSFK